MPSVYSHPFHSPSRRRAQRTGRTVSLSPLQPGSTPAARQRRSRTGRTVRAGPATDRAVTACFTAGAAVPHRRVMRSRATGTRPSICPRPCGVARLPRSDDGRPGSPRPVRDQPRAFRIKAPDRRPVPCRAQGQGRRLKPTRFCKWAPAVSRNHVLLIVGEVLISK